MQIAQSAQTILFLGGTRSGKSALAQRWAESVAPQRLYIATAQNNDTDADFAARIAQHRAQRGAGWALCEEPLALTDCLRRVQTPVIQADDATQRTVQVQGTTIQNSVILIDCITLWISNLLYTGHDAQRIFEDTTALADWLRCAPVPVGLVTTEVGCGLMPMNPLGRAFADIQGAVNQTLAAVCDTVLLVQCGLPLPLKGCVPKELDSRLRGNDEKKAEVLL